MKLLNGLFFIFIYATNISNAQTKNLVFEGAGIRGIAYCGALKILEEKNILSNIEKVGGTSAGAITALLVSLGYNSSEIYEIIANTKFQKFNDGQYFFIGGFARIIKKFGWYRGKKFTKWLEQIIEQKTGNANITFEQLHQKGFKDLYVTATCLNKQQLLILSKNNYPNMKIKDAIRASMAIPMYFEAVFIDSAGNSFSKNNTENNLDILVDGGIIGNYPIHIFDSINIDDKGIPFRIENKNTIGFKIDNDAQIKIDSGSVRNLTQMPISNLKEYIQAFYIFTLENLNRNNLNELDWQRSVLISDANIGPKVKKLSNEQKQKLLQSGENAVEKYYEGS